MFSDLALARRLDRAEALSGAHFVEARAKASPGSGAEWTEAAGAYLLYDGSRSPATQTFCLGLFQPATAADLDRIEAFFRDRGSPIFHDVSPLADKSTMPSLNSRGYAPVEFTSVMFLPIDRKLSIAPPENKNIRARLIGQGEHETWARTAAEGWRELEEIADLLPDLMRATAARTDMRSFLAELDGKPVAAGAMSIENGVALLAGASTIPEARNQGAQRALLEARLRYAVEKGCDLAMMCAEPGSASQRNAERHGFRIAYTRVKWGLQVTGG